MTLPTIYPEVIDDPPSKVSLTFFKIKSLSPVKTDSSTFKVPSKTSISAGTTSPPFKIIISSSTISSSLISVSVPSLITVYLDLLIKFNLDNFLFAFTLVINEIKALIITTFKNPYLLIGITSLVVDEYTINIIATIYKIMS